MGKFLDLTGLGYFKNKLDQVKAEKDTDAVEGNIAEFDANGNPVDSGIPSTKIGEIEEEVSVLRNSAGIAEGIADTISAGTPQEFVFRQSGGDGVNYMKRIKGRSIVWNQIVNINAFLPSSAAGTTFEIVDNKVRINGTATQTYDYVSPSGVKDSFVVGHKYLLRHRGSADIKGAVGANDGYPQFAPNADILLTVNTVREKSLFIEVTNGVTYNNAEAYFNIFDLTLMFGAGNEPSTVEEFKALFPDSYYAYNAGSVESNDAEALESVGRNVWDEEWEVGSLDLSGNNYPSTTRMRGKNYIPCVPGAEYYIKATEYCDIHFYDANKAHIDGYIQKNNQTFTAPANAAFMRFCGAVAYGATYLYDICINLSDPNFNGQYEPYWKRRIELGLKSFKVTDGTNVLTIDGLKSAGSVYDEIDFVRKKYIKRVGSVDLGSLTWTYTPSQKFKANLKTARFLVNYGLVSNLISEKYVSIAYTQLENKSISGVSESDAPTGQNIYLWDSAFSDAATFKTAMNGVSLYYELATPIEYDLVDDIPNSILVDNLGTEQAVFPVHNDETPSAPFCCDSNYSISVKNLVAFINAQNNG